MRETPGWMFNKWCSSYRQIRNRTSALNLKNTVLYPLKHSTMETLILFSNDVVAYILTSGITVLSHYWSNFFLVPDNNLVFLYISMSFRAQTIAIFPPSVAL